MVVDHRTPPHDNVGRGEAFAVTDRRGIDRHCPLWIDPIPIDGRNGFAPTNATNTTNAMGHDNIIEIDLSSIVDQSSRDQ
ncbi:MAG: hypothetical protein ACJ8CR_21720 [Roseiflexaceae bacterium]